MKGQRDKEGERREGKKKKKMGGQDHGGLLRRRLSGFIHSFIRGPGVCVWHCSRFWEYYSHLEERSSS